MKKLNRKGFTLIELLAVIAVTSLVLGLSTYGIINAFKNSKDAAIVINDKGILEAAKIRSSEENIWHSFNGGEDNYEYYCTSIQRLKNIGLLKKNVMSSDGNKSIIVVKRDPTTFNILEARFLDLTNSDDININSQLCKIEYFTIHYDYNVPGETGKVPEDQIEETCSNDSCNVFLSSTQPEKREGYNFKGWKLLGDDIIYKPGDKFRTGDAGEVITLYADWEVKTFKIIYDANAVSYSGTMGNTICEYNKECIVADNSFTNNGYRFVGWNTDKNGTGIDYAPNTDISGLFSTKKITLYAKWVPSKKVTILYSTNGGTITPNTESISGNKYSWQTDSNNIISRKVNNGSYINNFFTIKYGEEKDLVNYNNPRYINISIPRGKTVQNGQEWKCLDCSEPNRVYSQSESYSFEDFCGDAPSDCTVRLAVNFENSELLSPVFVASDGIASGKWHNKDYELTIISNNTSNVTYEYKIGEDGQTLQYNNSSPITPSEGKETYYAWSSINSETSNINSYVSMLDTIAPAKPTIDNPTNGNWTNKAFSLTYHSSDSGSGIKYYQYTYVNKPKESDWVTYENSAFDDFVSTLFKKERNQLVYVRACDYAGNCSAVSSTYIRLDTTAPDVPTIDNPYNNTWSNKAYDITLSSSDNLSGIARYEYVFGNSTPWTSGNINVHPNSNSNTITRTWKEERNSSLYERACDYAGNCSEPSKTIVKIDKTAPSKPTIDNPYNNTWSNKSYDITLSSSDKLSGIARYEYVFGDNTAWTSGNINVHPNSSSNTITRTWKEERNSSLYERACDHAGNCSEPSKTVVKIDKTAPSKPTIDNPYNNTWSNKSYDITLSSSDNLSGIARYECVYGDNTAWTSDNIYVHPNSNSNTITRAWNSERNSSLYERACDYAGNCSEPSKTIVKIDKTAPSVPVLNNPNNNKWVKEGYNFTASSSDSLSGLAKYEYKFDDESSWTVKESSENSITNSFWAERNSIFYERACDNAGNCSSASQTTIKIDKTPPSVSAVLMNGSTVLNSDYYRFSYDSSLKWFYGFTPTIRWTASDTVSGINSSSALYYYNQSGGQTLDANHKDYSNNGTTSNMTTTSNNNTYYYTVGNIFGGYRKFKLDVCDNAGNCSESPIYLKYYANSASTKYVKVNTGSYLNCRATPKSFGVSIKQFNCGNTVSVLQSYAGNWYYNVNDDCYLSGNYLASSSPNCSSGGGSGGGVSDDTGNDYYNCRYCNARIDCDIITGVSVKCENNYCIYYMNDVKQGCE